LNLNAGEYDQQNIQVTFEELPTQGHSVNANCPICISQTKNDWLQYATTWGLVTNGNLQDGFVIEWSCSNCRSYRITSKAINSLLSEVSQTRYTFREFLLNHMPLNNGKIKIITFKEIAAYLLPRKNLFVETVLASFKDNVLDPTKDSAWQLTVNDVSEEYWLQKGNVIETFETMEAAGYLYFNSQQESASISKLGEWAINVPGLINQSKIKEAKENRKKAGLNLGAP
jgi:hypothetical protein